jgi:hypothetical protein
VLFDEDGTAAEIVGTKRLGLSAVVKPGAYGAALRSVTGGHRQRRAGRRPTQLGATIVIGPGNDLRYEDYEDYAGDHADLDEVLAVLG